MAVADDLERQRAALTMIHAEPFNAEAPPEALDGDVTPTALHYVRSNFPVPDHDGTLEIAGAVENPLTLTLDDLRATAASRARRHTRMRRERPTRDEAASRR